jgi:hypothetical protein
MKCVPLLGKTSQRTVRFMIFALDLWSDSSHQGFVDGSDFCKFLLFISVRTSDMNHASEVSQITTRGM